MFTNACLHSGGANESNYFQLRLFTYLVSNEMDFPQNQVMLYNWTDDTDNARIASATMPSEKEKLSRIKSNGQQKVKCSHPKGRLRYETDRYGKST